MNSLKSLYLLKAFGVKYIKYEHFLDIKPRNIPKNCKLCKLCKTRTNIIKDNAIDNENIVFIAFAPNKHEDINNTCDKDTIHQMFDITNFYLTYITKCYGNPSKNDIKICLSHLINEIITIKPKLIVALGDEVFYSLGYKNLKILRGILIDFYGFKLISSYNLDFVKKNPNSKDIFLNNINNIKKHIKGIR